MDALEAIEGRRAIRQFQREKVPREILEKLCKLGGLAPSAANLQPLKFLVVDEPGLAGKMFHALRWAAHMPDWVPDEERQPPAYILVLADSGIRESSYEYDVGMAAENIMVAAAAYGLGSCCLSIPDKGKVASLLKIPGDCTLTLAVALGYPAEKSRTAGMAGSIKYFRDDSGMLHVPKRNSADTTYFNRIE